MCRSWLSLDTIYIMAVTCCNVGGLIDVDVGGCGSFECCFCLVVMVNNELNIRTLPSTTNEMFIVVRLQYLNSKPCPYRSLPAKWLH